MAQSMLDPPWIILTVIGFFVTVLLIGIIGSSLQKTDERKQLEKSAGEEVFYQNPQNAEEDPRVIKKDGLSCTELMYLVRKQTVAYQVETRARARSSFMSAILAMFMGMVFVIAGGACVILLPGKQGWEPAAAGPPITVFGSVLSGFIAKTFLDVHKISLKQLNRYFQQPVLSWHILSAGRIADALGAGDNQEGREALESILTKVSDLIERFTATDELDGGPIVEEPEPPEATTENKDELAKQAGEEDAEE